MAKQPYPAEYETDVVLKDGSVVRLRPVRESDADMMAALHERLSARSVYLRFHRAVQRVPEADIRHLVDVDYDHEFALVATTGEAGAERIIAVAFYARLEESARAEVAFTVEDSHQGRGIATVLLDHLATIARDRGIEVFEADVLGENRSMMEVFRESGYPLRARIKYGTYHVSFPIAPTEEAEQKSAEREVVATSASVRAFFEPESVAVIGASRERGTIGAEIFHNILDHGYSGVVYPINPKAEHVGAVRAYPSVLEVPDDVELAIIAVPAEHVLGVVDECAQKGVRGLVIISAGFGEAGETGKEREAALLAKAHGYGMRIVGPNCMGVLNADPAVSLNGTFSPVFPPFGNVGLLSQSGALGLALLDYSRTMNIGLSTFVSVGNKVDVSSNDIIQYWEQDPSTEVILLYLESVGNPRKFARLARRISARKPIVAVKSGRTTAGSRAAASHTGALASTDAASEALFRQAGVIRTDTLEELFDVASLLAHQPPPKGRRVAILTNAGGPGILAADACESHGLEVPRLSDDALAALREFLPPEAGLNNPVDMIASASADDYRRGLRVLLNDPGVDSVIVIFIPPLVTQAEDVARAIRETAAEFADDKTLLACFMSVRGAPPELSSDRQTLPSFIFPESAALALAKVSRYAEWRSRPAGIVPEFEVDTDEARRIVDGALEEAADGRTWLSAEHCTRLLALYGIPSAELKLARSAEAAAQIAAEIGFPVALKLASRTITHKTDVGGVLLGLRSPENVWTAFETIAARIGTLGRSAEMDGAYVQPMVEGGVEAIVGVTHDPVFGPLIMFGLGGVFVELLKDVAFRIQPLTDIDAREMIRSIKGYPLLEGWRGGPAGDVAALEELLLRVSALIEDVPEIAEMDLNPVKALAPGQGCVVVDARILVRG